MCKNHLSVKITRLLSVKALECKNSVICKNCYVQKGAHMHGSLRADLGILWVNAIFRHPLNENLLTYRYEILQFDNVDETNKLVKNTYDRFARGGSQCR
jgi:hypothetical protein